MGPNGDGGYLVPDDLENIEACFSPGVDKISEFEKACSLLEMKIFMADKSVDNPILDIEKYRYKFLKKYIGITSNEDYITMDNWVNSNLDNTNSDLLLQMDIENSEYISIANMSEDLLNRFRIIVIEFHNLQCLWEPQFFNLCTSVFDKLLMNHSIVHIHPNNCCGSHIQSEIEIPRVAEFTFLRNDRISFTELQKSFPHKLDHKNTDNKDLVLPNLWFQEN